MKDGAGVLRSAGLTDTGFVTRAVRALMKRRFLTVVSIATLGIGIGAATATLTISNDVLMQPLPVREQRRLVVLWGQDQAVQTRQIPLPYGSYRDFAAAGPRTIVEVAAVDYHGAFPNPVRDGAEGVNLRVSFATGNLFQVLGVEPLLGRPLRPDDDTSGSAAVAAISYGLWQRRYGGAPTVLGRVITLRGQAATIVAVMPRGFAFPAQTEVWVTARPYNAVAETGPPNFFVHLVGRLAPDATIAHAQSELAAHLTANAAALPSTLRGMGAVAYTFDEYVVGDVKPTIRMLMAASALVLVVAIVNVGALFLTLGLTRRQEGAILVSLGATKTRLLVQSLTEAALVAAGGATVGVGLAYGLIALVVRLASQQLPRVDAIGISPASIGFTVVVAVLATLALAVFFVYGQRSADVPKWLRMSVRATTAPRSVRQAQQALVFVQVASAVTVMMGAGLVARSQWNLETIAVGVAGERTLLLQVVPPQQSDYADVTRFNANLDHVSDAIAALPGVQSVVPTLTEPFGGMAGWDARYLLEGQAPEEQSRQPLLNFEIAAPDFFRTMDIPILRGRAFTTEDHKDGRPVFIVSESTARLAWPNKDAVGQQVKISGAPWGTVIGVAADTRYRDLTAVRPTVYRPRAQVDVTPSFLAIRASGVNPLALAASIRAAAQQAWPGALFPSLRTINDYVAEPLARPRVTAALFVGFAVVALSLSALGLYGVISATMVERTREIGIRMALGSSRKAILRSVLAEGARLTLSGLAVGTILALSSSGWLEATLYGVNHREPMPLLVVALFVCVVTGLAAYVPARRAANVEPSLALREW